MRWMLFVTASKQAISVCLSLLVIVRGSILSWEHCVVVLLSSLSRCIISVTMMSVWRQNSTCSERANTIDRCHPNPSNQFTPVSVCLSLGPFHWWLTCFSSPVLFCERLSWAGTYSPVLSLSWSLLAAIWALANIVSGRPWRPFNRKLSTVLRTQSHHHNITITTSPITIHVQHSTIPLSI